MEATDENLYERARDAFTRILPYEEAVQLERATAHHLAKSLGVKQLSSPMALIDADPEATPSEALRGKPREFVEEVHKVQKLRAEFAKLQEEHKAAAAAAATAFQPAPQPPRDDDPEARLLELQLEVNKMEQERERLLVINETLDELDKKPAAAPDFLEPEAMFKDCNPLPDLPSELINGFTEDQEAPDHEIQELMSRLRKAVLRNKLLAQRERKKVDEARARNPVDPSSLPPEAQLHALNAVKDTLINWIETMLSKAGDDEAGLDPESPVKTRRTAHEEVDHEAQMTGIKREYDHHIELRKKIMSTMAQLKDLKLEQRRDDQPSKENKAKPKNAEPQAYLLIPYLEKLQTISREQKGLIQEKSHINTTFSKQQQDTSETLGHLVDESQLLAKYPSAKPSEPESSFSDATRGVMQSTLARQMEPWIYAADSAKIATLEAVAERVEEGHMAADDAMQALDQVRKLLNKEEATPVDDQADQGRPEDDLWLAEEGGDKGMRVRKHTEKKPEKDQQESIWAKLDGNLGLINE